MFVPLEYRSFWGALIIYSDPGTLGLFFSGAIILLERNQQLLTYMFVTPVTLRTFLASKIISLFLIGLLTSVLIASVSLNTTFSLIQLTIAVMLCSVFLHAVV
ncbi:hypothetical protein [Bacillus sp. JCM 19034]|uniref:hypothetical protein n=1 Tax=Bacillus sp. JCM 19034 TaxID=1481928 RepID=UPI000780D44F|nr:hypothetical protein [Bacillus sp. JCM 19034]